MRELLDKHADPKISIETGASPLYVAAMKGHREVCRMLLGCGRADANQTPGHQKTPLLVAIVNGHEEAFRFSWVCLESMGTAEAAAQVNSVETTVFINIIPYLNVPGP